MRSRSLRPLRILIATLSLSAACASPAPELRDGDIIFQHSRSAQSQALEIATGSLYTHMGILFLEEDGPIVLEAVGPVKRTPLADWIRRGEKGRFVVKRLTDAGERLTPDSIARLKKAGESYLGRPYDLWFEWSDDRIYCSELVWKMYKKALDLEIGKTGTFRDFNLSDPAVSEKLAERFGGRIPMDETVVSPAGMFASEKLVTVLDNWSEKNE